MPERRDPGDRVVVNRETHGIVGSSGRRVAGRGLLISAELRNGMNLCATPAPTLGAWPSPG